MCPRSAGDERLLGEREGDTGDDKGRLAADRYFHHYIIYLFM